MAKSTYSPPRQRLIGTVVDSLLMLVLVFCALKAPAWMKAWRSAPEAAKESPAAGTPPAAVTWEDLGQNAEMRAAWEKMGKDPAAAKAIIDTRFDYTIDVVKLVFVGLLLAFYFYYMLSRSAKQYRQVISERFD